MRSIVLSTAARYVLPVLFVFSIFVLLRGHNEPGGGFVGGLVAAAGFALYALAENVEAARRALRRSPREYMAFGLLLALSSGLYSLFVGKQFMEGIWTPKEVDVPVFHALGTPFFFDLGIYLVVIGVVLNIVFTFFEDLAE